VKINVLCVGVMMKNEEKERGFYKGMKEV